MEICIQDKCTGCSACYSSCNRQAITMQKNAKGFLHPVIDEEKCVNCGLCKAVCPVNHMPTLHTTPEPCFACKNKNSKTRKKSTSGGVFSALAENVLNAQGVVFGVVFNEDFTSVYHEACYSVKDLEAFRGSKYMQSNVGDTFNEVKENLTKGKTVLFSGTPCQIAGLRNYLQKPYPALLTVDIICHGTPSPDVYARYKTYIMEKLGCEEITAYYFRNKDYGWSASSTKVYGDNGKIYCQSNRKDFFFHTFNKELFLNACCHDCQYTHVERVADITLADFWGYVPRKYCMRDDGKGTSLVLVNTEKGKAYFEKIRNKMISNPESIAMAIAGNKSLKESWQKNEKSEEFWTRFHNHEDIDAIMQSYVVEKPSKKTPKAKKIARNLFLLVPEKMRAKIKKLLKR